MSYEEYLKEWVEQSNGKGSPMTRGEWKQVQYLKGTPEDREYVETYKIYDKIFKLILEIDKLRCKLMYDRVHIQLIGEELAKKNNDKYFSAIDTFWNNKESGMCELKELLLQKDVPIEKYEDSWYL